MRMKIKDFEGFIPSVGDCFPMGGSIYVTAECKNDDKPCVGCAGRRWRNCASLPQCVRFDGKDVIYQETDEGSVTKEQMRAYTSHKKRIENFIEFICKVGYYGDFEKTNF